MATAAARLLPGRVSLVTGASRGIGRGIALQLGDAGSTVYITGRVSKDIVKTCNEIRSRGGCAIPVTMDHADDKQVEKLFEQINYEQNGRLDVLVNNAYTGISTMLENKGKPFWETPPERTWDSINGVGLRNNYLCTVHAARLMVPRETGLIVNISSAGGLVYLFNVAYGVGKTGLDRMSADAGHELKSKGVTVISLWPGPVKTESVKTNILDNTHDPGAKKFRVMYEDGESVEFSGKAVVQLAADKAVHKKTGRIQMTADLAREYGFVDENGTVSGDNHSLKLYLTTQSWYRAAVLVPSWLKSPTWLTHYMGNKLEMRMN